MIYRLTYTLILPNGERRDDVSEFRTEALAWQMYEARKRLHLLYANVQFHVVTE